MHPQACGPSWSCDRKSIRWNRDDVSGFKPRRRSVRGAPRLWQARSMVSGIMTRRVLKLPGCCELVVSRRGTYVLAVGKTVVVANLRSGERCLSSRALANPAHAAFNEDETRLAVRNTLGDVLTLDLADGRVLARCRAKSREEGAEVHYSPCSDFIVEATWNGVVRVRRSDTLALVEAFTFPGEMITRVSRTADGSRWLFAHQPVTRDGENWSPPPYLTLWDWPLRSPSLTLDPQFYTVGAASVSPCGSWIACAGALRARADGTLPTPELRISERSGKLRWATDITIGGTGWQARWSGDSRFVATVVASGISILEAHGLVLRQHVACDYPSDVAFSEDGAHAMLATWQKTWMVPI